MQYEYGVAIDFLITDKSNEIYEISAKLFKLPSGNMSSVFHCYVAPTEQLKLPKEPEMIVKKIFDTGISLSRGLDKFEDWRKQNFLCFSSNQTNCIMVTWNSYVLDTVLRNECTRKGIYLPGYLRISCNLNKVFMKRYGYKIDLNAALKRFQIPPITNSNSLTINTLFLARLTAKMVADDCSLRVNNN